MTALLLDLELARRIELAEARSAVEAAVMLEQRRPESGAAVESIAGGFAVYCGANSPITQAAGLGLNGAVSEEEFDRLEAFYKSRKEAVRVETCPLADASLIKQFRKHGYGVTEFSNVMVRPVRGSDSANNVPVFAPGIAIERAGREHIDLWTLTVAQGFSENAPVPQELFEVMKMFARRRARNVIWRAWTGKSRVGGRLRFGMAWRVFLGRARCRNFANAACRRRCCMSAWGGRQRRGAIWRRVSPCQGAALSGT